MTILISACLLGVSVRYDGKSKPHADALALLDRHHLIPVCAEVMGGLPTPRVPAERVGSRVITRDGRDVTAEYEKGAAEIVRLAKLYSCRLAILKEKSPSCGNGRIYDGTFTATLTDGQGVLAQRLCENGITVIGESMLKDKDAFASLVQTLCTE